MISNDSDLKHPIEIVRNELKVPVGLLNPHPKLARELANIADFYKPIRKGVIEAIQFADELSDADGAFRKPASW